MEEDEDVLVEGSALHKHLQETGYSDFEVMESQNEKKKSDNDCFEEANRRHKDNFAARPFAQLNCIGLSVIERDFAESISSRAIRTKILEEDDLLTLESLSPSVEIISKTPIKLYEAEEKTLLYFMFAFLGIVTLLFSRIMNFVAMERFENVSLIVFQEAVVLFVVLLLLLFAGTIIYISIIGKRYFKFIRIIETTLSVTRRSLKFLNEINLLKKGLRHKAAELDITECSVENCLFEGLSDLQNLLARQILHFQEDLRSKMETRNPVIHSLFAQRYKLTVKTPEGQESSPLAQLKMKRDLLMVQISGLLSELILSFESSKNLSLFSECNVYEWQVIDNMALDLQRTLILSERVWQKKEPALKAIVKPRKSLEDPRLNILNVSESLFSHCRLATYSGQYLKDWASKLYNDNMGRYPDELDEVRIGSKEIRNELMASIACLEEIEEHCDAFMKPKVERKNEEERKEGENEEKEEPVLPVCGLEDPIIVDECYEAVVKKVVDPSPVEEEEWMKSRKEEKSIRKQQRKRCKRVMQEIQPLLLKRRELYMEREAKALKMTMQRQGEEKEGIVDSGLSLSCHMSFSGQESLGSSDPITTSGQDTNTTKNDSDEHESNTPIPRARDAVPDESWKLFVLDESFLKVPRHSCRCTIAMPLDPPKTTVSTPEDPKPESITVPSVSGEEENLDSEGSDAASSTSKLGQGSPTGGSLGGHNLDSLHRNSGAQPERKVCIEGEEMEEDEDREEEGSVPAHGSGNYGFRFADIMGTRYKGQEEDERNEDLREEELQTEKFKKENALQILGNNEIMKKNWALLRQEEEEVFGGVGEKEESSEEEEEEEVRGCVEGSPEELEEGAENKSVGEEGSSEEDGWEKVDNVK